MHCVLVVCYEDIDSFLSVFVHLLDYGFLEHLLGCLVRANYFLHLCAHMLVIIQLIGLLLPLHECQLLLSLPHLRLSGVVGIFGIDRLVFDLPPELADTFLPLSIQIL